MRIHITKRAAGIEFNYDNGFGVVCCSLKHQGVEGHMVNWGQDIDIALPLP